MNKQTNNTQVNTKKQWSKEENEQLIKAVKNKQNETLTKVFADFAEKHNRPVGSVSQHYYHHLAKNSEENKPKSENKKSETKAKNNTQKTASQKNSKTPDVTILISKIRKMPTRAITSLSYIVNNMNV